ncbi:hypothetical protein DFQ27_009195 [Actinomortierella ambigua]|uniref:Uncharacterized protein n=1 Tax=Actinomortierella ambigua TaxID=1343610 RepID=A0A9P6UAX7_9FUNG|nr:hypothetical protein DFQ27_009195 [Actinomortierella ambigua]
MTLTFAWFKSAIADTIHIQEQASAELYAGQTVPISYEIHHNGLAKLMWVKLHLMTEDGQDAGPGTIDTMERSDWEDTLPVQIRATKDSNLPLRANNDVAAAASHSSVSLRLGRSLAKLKRSLYVQPDEDEHTRQNTKRFLYLISDQF